MFPIFLWVEEYKGFKNFQINLDNEYECKIELGEDIVTLRTEDNKKEETNIFKLKENQHIKKKSIIIKDLEIRKNKNYKKLTSFYGNNIKNLKIIVGKNGTGKSSILEFLTIENKRDYNYLLICKPINAKDSEKLFYVEGNLPAIFSKEALEFIENKDEVRELTNIFTFYMNIDNKVLHLAQEDYRTKESLIGRIKYSENNKGIKNNSRDDIEIKRFNSNYNFSYEYLYVFLNDIYNTALYENYKNIKIEIIFKDNKGVNLDESFYNEKEREIIRAMFKKIDITTDIKEEIKQARILRGFCNDIYRYILENKLKKTYKSNYTNNYEQLKTDIIVLDKETREEYKKISLKELLKELLNYDSFWMEDYYEQYIELYRIIEENKYFNNEFQSINIVGEINLNDLKLLRLTDLYLNNKVTNEIYKFFEIKSISESLSDGEKAFISLFSTVNYFVTEFGNKNEGMNIWVRKKYITLMFDEPDLYLHPEWCRIFLSKLLEVLNTYKDIDLYKDLIFNVIIVTHSPYLLSDVMNEDVIYLTKGKEGNPLAEMKSNKTFCANIMNLYKDSFFMESTFGEFAKIKIQEIIDELNGDKKVISEERKIEIWETIQMIGENLVRKKMENMYYEYFKEDKFDKIITELNELSEEQKEQVYKYLQVKKANKHSKKDRF